MLNFVGLAHLERDPDGFRRAVEGIGSNVTSKRRGSLPEEVC